jgi:hypothetical protein
MKTLYNSILGDIESNLEAGNQFVDRQLVIDFLSDNYNYTYITKSWNISEKPNKKGLYEVSCTSSLGILLINFNIESLTNGLFEFTECENFICSGAMYLKSLQGSPRIVKDTFNCANCNSLKTLKDCPKEAKTFFCQNCGKKFTIHDVTKLCKVKKDRIKI